MKNAVNDKNKFLDALPDQVKQQSNFPVNYLLVDQHQQHGSIFHTVKSDYYRASQYECSPYGKPISKCFNNPTLKYE